MLTNTARMRLRDGVPGIFSPKVQPDPQAQKRLQEKLEQVVARLDARHYAPSGGRGATRLRIIRG